MLGFVRHLGWRSVSNVFELGGITLFGSQLVFETLRPPWRLRRVVDEIYNTGVLSLAIVLLSGAVVGSVLGLQGFITLERFGAEQSLGGVVGLSLVREFGPVLTALLVAGRAGSAIAAEIGAMVATEQLDGLRMMSVDPIDFVAQPKALRSRSRSRCRCSPRSSSSADSRAATSSGSACSGSTAARTSRASSGTSISATRSSEVF